MPCNFGQPVLLLTAIGPGLTMEVRAALYSTGAEAAQPPGANSSTQPRPLACAPSEEAARRNPRGGLGISPRAAVGVLAEATNKLATVYVLQERLHESAKLCREALGKKPRHFGAASGLAQELVGLGSSIPRLRLWRQS